MAGVQGGWGDDQTGRQGPDPRQPTGGEHTSGPLPYYRRLPLQLHEGL